MTIDDSRTARGEPVLAARGIEKSFFGSPALRDGSIEIRAGEVHALLGENGAGKSTLIKILAGVYQRDAGEIVIAGEELPARITPARVRDLGLAFIHQDLALVADADIAENIAVSAGYPTRRGLVSPKRMREQAAERLLAVGSHLDPTKVVGELNSADQALVAIARALVGGARVVVLDEPTARLHGPEVDHLFEQLRRLRRNGASFLYVTHRLGEVAELADRATVLRDGRTVATRVVAETSEQEVISLIVGRDLDEVFPPKDVEKVETATPVLAMEGVKTAHIDRIDLEVHPCEILGVTGLVSQAPSSVAQAAFGIEEALEGSVRFEGREVRSGSVPPDVAAVGYVPADRRAEGLALDLTIRENILLGETVVAGAARSALKRMLAPAFLPRAEDERARRHMERFQIKPPDGESLVATLSGGNQQKVLLAKWMALNPRLLILEEPTAGVDIGTKAEIYAMVADLAAAGTAVLLVSSDFEEVAALSHRVLVLAEGGVVELTDDALDRDRIAAECYRGGWG